MTDAKKIFFQSEDCKFQVEVASNQTKVVKLSGLAIPFGKLSRNGVRYRENSIKEKFKTLENVAILFNHNSDIVLGHTEYVALGELGVEYRADLDSKEEDYIRKIERGDIRHVSIGAMVSNPEFNEDGTVTVDILEFVELSAVPVPGFKDASGKINQNYNDERLLIAEAFGNQEVVAKLKIEADKKAKEDEEKKAQEEEKDKEKTEDKNEQSKESTVEERIGKVEASLKEQEALNEELKNRLAITESRLDVMEESKDERDTEEEKETEAEGEKEENPFADKEDSKEDEKEAEAEEGEKEKEKEETFKRAVIPKGIPTNTEQESRTINLAEARLKNLSY
jgi:HK97 family phage prohead protease